MKSIDFLHIETAATLIEMTLMDDKQREKKALLFFGDDDGWFENDLFHSPESFWAGTLMNAAQRDNTVVMFQAKAFKILNGEVTKHTIFSPMMKHNGSFKSFVLKRDGTPDFY